MILLAINRRAQVLGNFVKLQLTLKLFSLKVRQHEICKYAISYGTLVLWHSHNNKVESERSYTSKRAENIGRLFREFETDSE